MAEDHHAYTYVTRRIAHSRRFPVSLPEVSVEQAERVLPRVVSDPERYIVVTNAHISGGIYSLQTQLWLKDAWETRKQRGNPTKTNGGCVVS